MNPPTSSTSRSTCKVCFVQGHLYRDCQHPCINEFHHQAINILVASKTDNRHLGGMAFAVFFEELPTYVARALLWKYKHPELCYNEHGNAYPTYSTVRGWRERETHGHPKHSLPVRVGVYSSASRFDLSDMMYINYTKYSEEYMESHSIINERRVVMNNTRSIATMLSRVRRDLVSSHNVFTQEGLVAYTNELITYLQAMNQQTQRVTDSPVSPNLLPELSPAFVDPYVDEFTHFRHRPTIINMARAALPIPPPISVENLNAPPPPAPNRAPVFNVDLVQKAPEEMTTLTHTACTICWDELAPETMCSTDCNHSFCYSCVNACLVRARQKHVSQGRTARYLVLKCAMCRNQVSALSSYSDSDETTAHVLELRRRLYSCGAAPPVAAST